MQSDILRSYLDSFTDALKLDNCVRIWEYHLAPELYKLWPTTGTHRFIAVTTAAYWPRIVPQEARNWQNPETMENVYQW